MPDAKEEEVNALDMSDEDFAKLDFDALPEDKEEEEEEVVEEDNSETSDEVTDAAEETVEEETDENDVEEKEEEEDESDGSAKEEVKDPDADEDDDKAESDVDKETKEKPDKDTKVEEKAPEVDYEAAGKRLFEPFKANGKEIQVTTIDDAISLMQKGANYNKKMLGLKPNLKLLKMLENHDLLDEEKLSYLIDLDKKDPKAVTKLVKESGVDPLDIDLKAPDEYKPSTYTVDDKTVALDEVLGEIRDTDSYDTTISIIGSKWDNTSKDILVANPSIIKIINEHVESGAYQTIQSKVDSERMFGRLVGLSDLEAYKQVGDAINKEGGFSAPDTTGDILQKPLVKAKEKTVDPKLKSRKKAASSTNRKATSAKKENFNPLSMSDEEFEKMAASEFI